MIKHANADGDCSKQPPPPAPSEITLPRRPPFVASIAAVTDADNMGGISLTRCDSSP